MSLFLPKCIYNLHTGRISLICATGCQTRFADCFQRYCIVGAACDASQETVVLKSVTLCLSFWRLQCCYICLCARPNRPADICYRLCHLSYYQVIRATRSLKRTKKRSQFCFVLGKCKVFWGVATRIVRD